MSDMDETIPIEGRRKRGLQCSNELGAVVPLLAQGGLWKQQHNPCRVASGQRRNQASTKAGTVFCGVWSTYYIISNLPDSERHG